MNLVDIIKKGSTDRSVVVRIIDSTDGTPETGVLYNTAGIDLWYRREGAAKTSITEATLAALTTAHADGGFLHVSDGAYRLDLPDAAFATGANYVDFGGTVTGMVVIGGRVKLVAYDPEDAAGLGLSRVDVASSTLATAANLATLDDFVDTEVAAIKAKTDNLPSDPADASDIAASFASIAATLATIAAYVDTEVAAIKAKTDNLPTDPADASDISSSFSTVNSTLATIAAYIDTEIAAIKAKTDTIPASPASQSVLDKLDTAIELDGAVYRLTTNALELAPTGGSAPTAAAIRAEIDSNSTQLAAILADTATLPADPADASDIAASFSTVNSTLSTIAGYLDTEVAAIKAKTDLIPAGGPPAASIFTGITLLAGWLRLMARKDTAATTDYAASLTEINVNGGTGAGAYAATTDSQEATRDRGDAAWTTGGGASSVIIGPIAATVTDVAIAASTGGVIAPLSMFKSQRATIVFAIVDGNGAPVDITGDALSFVIHNAAGTTFAEINSTDEAAQFVVGDSGAVGATGDQLTLTIEPTQNNQTAGAYFYKLWNTTLDCVIATGKYQIIVAPQS